MQTEGVNEALTGCPTFNEVVVASEKGAEEEGNVDDRQARHVREHDVVCSKPAPGK